MEISGVNSTNVQASQNYQSEMQTLQRKKQQLQKQIQEVNQDNETEAKAKQEKIQLLQAQIQQIDQQIQQQQTQKQTNAAGKQNENTVASNSGVVVRQNREQGIDVTV